MIEPMTLCRALYLAEHIELTMESAKDELPHKWGIGDEGTTFFYIGDDEYHDAVALVAAVKILGRAVERLA